MDSDTVISSMRVEMEVLVWRQAMNMFMSAKAPAVTKAAYIIYVAFSFDMTPSYFSAFLLSHNHSPGLN